MKWNIAAECVSVIILCIIWVYSRHGNSLPTLKNRLFQACFFVTFLAMTTNILSTLSITYASVIPIWLNWVITTVYFAATPLMGMVYFYYSLSILYDDEETLPKQFYFFSLPAVIYTLLVLLNPFNGWLFVISGQGGYAQGPLIEATYIIFYIYCLGCLGIVIFKREKLDRMIRRILAIFPLIAAMVILFQAFFPQIILSGSAATCALLIIYLYLQNKQITIDSLLKVPNRNEFYNTLKLHFRKKGSVPFAIVILSLREFKRINDAYGRQNGDEFLETICSYLKEETVPYRLYRFSGDEFAIFMENHSEDVLLDLVQKLLRRMKEPWKIREFSSTIAAAVGVVQYPESAGKLEEIINAIDYSLANAKASKKSNVFYATQAMMGTVRRRHQIIDVLKETLVQDAFDLYLQPIWSVKEKRFTMGEALLRLRKSSMGPLYPSEMIPIAEETGLIIDMTYQILDKTCRVVRHLVEADIEFESISVNFSGLMFTQYQLVERVLRIIERNGINYDKIKIEITESVLSENPESMTKFIEQMHEHGVQVELDDFGTGYCNLVAVMSMPLDIVKVDKSLLWWAMKNEKAAMMMKSITAAVRELNMRVVVEGVETGEQEQFVEECGCEWIQGFLYAKPMPVNEAIEVFQQNRDRKGE